MPSAFLLIDTHAQLTFVNRAAAAELEVEPSQLIGHRVWSACARVLPRAAVARCRCAVKARAGIRFDSESTRGDRWLEVSVNPARQQTSLHWHDITARKSAEHALLDAEERARMTAEAGLVGLFDWDLSTGNMHWSDHLYRILGLEPGSVAPSYEAWAMRVHPDDLPAVKAVGDQHRENRFPLQDEHRVVWPDGTIHVVERRAQFWFDGAGVCRRMRGTYADVTERANAEARLRESEARFRVMADDTPLGIWVTNAGGQIQFANRRYCEFMGVNRDVPADPDWTYVHPDDHAYPQAFLASVQAHTAFEGRARVRRKDGEWRWITSRGRPRFSSAGEFLGLVCSSIDVTNHVEAEERERAQVVEAHFRSLFEAVPGLLVVLTPYDYDIVAVSDAYLAATNTTRGALIGQRFFEAFPRDPAQPVPEAEAHLRASFARVVTGRRVDVIGVHQFPLQRSAESGGGFEERWWSPVTAPVLTPNGDVAYLIHRVEDVTPYVTGSLIAGGHSATPEADRRLHLMAAEVVMRAQELQRANERLRDNEQRLQREVEDRRRLEEIRGHLIRQLVSVQEDERRRVARELHDSFGQHLTALSITLASLGKRPDLPTGLAADIERLQRIAVDLDEEVDHLASELRPLALDDLGLRDAIQRHVDLWASDTGITADLHLRGLDGRVGDTVETTVYRVVQEALTNVRRHANASRVSVVVERRDGEVIAVIEDDGVGFALPTAVANGDSTRRLGLSTMRERASLVEGRLEIESLIGRGTTVFLHVPIHG